MNDSGHLNTTRGRRDTSLTRNGSESGGWREFYGQEAGSRSAGNVRDSADAYNTNEPPVKGKKNLDAENWIHRDKLARIESEELHQAAILFQRRNGAESKASRARSQEQPQNSVPGAFPATPPTTEHSEPWPNLQDEPSVPFNDGTYDPIEDERQNWDLRRPEEIAADEMDDGSSSIYRNPTLRKSSSRIPISTASPAPILPDQDGREPRKQRSRAPTTSNEEGLSIPKPRRASEPTAADADGSPPTTGSRPASRGTPSAQNNSARRTPRGTSGSSNRKTSAPPTSRKTTPRSRATSGNGGPQRPTTRSGETRPTTAVNRPEGDPPWLATMYKPDPRLPPDQQILPTHARKMQQEQWAKEGKATTTYDRDFTPLAVRADDPSRINKAEKEDEKGSKGDEEKEEKVENTKEPTRPEPAWPLASSKEAEAGSKPGANTGYSTIPKVQETPQTGLSPKWNPPVVTADQQPPRKEKGCGCCIVM